MSYSFNNITQKEVIRLFILMVVNIVIFIALYIKGYILLLLLSFFGLSLLIVGLILSLHEKWEKDYWYLSSLILAVVSLAPSILWKPNLSERLNHSFYAKNTFDFKQYTKENPDTYYKFIFCFDNTGGYLNNKSKKNSNIIYTDLLKEQLKNDLQRALKNNETRVENNETSNDFMVVPIFDPNHKFPYEFKDLTNDNVNDAIQQLFNYQLSTLQSKNIISDFFNLYDNIEEKCVDSITTLFIYSDFVYDLTYKITKPTESEKQSLDKNQNDIKKKQQKLLEKNITTVAFFASPSKLNADERDVFPHRNAKDGVFLRCYNIDENEEEPIPLRIRRVDNLPFFYYDDIFKTYSELWLTFEKTGNHIIDVDKAFKIHDGNEEYEFNPQRGLKNKKILMEYNGEKAPDNLPQLKIIQDEVHYISKSSFASNGSATNIYLFILWSCGMGVIAGFWLRNNKMKN